MTILSISFYVKYKARNSIFSHVQNVPKIEFAIVLEAAIKNNNQPGDYLKYRLVDVLALFKAGKIEKS